ncbi:sigma-54-dependent Fis family transcriptional regulator, partial [Candidatus Sumerlaeota bacterium]|nr:sigma-54-dependent Fis family transcriptional regulator [Candidatus Sumerlaeota bacterium]
ELRIPDSAGIVGEVIQTGATLRVDDAYSDSRFNPAVDKESGYRTRNLICVPMRDAEGRMIGAFEAINKNQGAFNTDDEESLTQLGVHAATAMQNTREWEELIRSRQQLTEQIAQGVRIIGDSAAIVALRETIKRLAATDLPVLVLGESGTGKEVVAQALHFQGPRAQHPFVAVNCAALTESLLESELFGHEKGAFTDAHEMRQGKFELADGGTLFLDEIGQAPIAVQEKILRAVEYGSFERVGNSKSIESGDDLIKELEQGPVAAKGEGDAEESKKDRSQEQPGVKRIGGRSGPGAGLEFHQKEAQWNKKRPRPERHVKASLGKA